MRITGTSIRSWAAVGIVLLCALSAGAQNKTTYNTFARDEQELAKVEKQWSQAMEREDVATIGKILADDYTMIDPVGVSVGKAETIQQLQSGNLKYDSVSTSDIKFRVFQGGAVITGRAMIKGKFKDKDISGEYRFVDVLELRKGTWQAVYTQLSQVRTEKK